MDCIAEKLTKELGEGYRIIRALNDILLNRKSAGMKRTVGNHINFLRHSNGILLPFYVIE